MALGYMRRHRRWLYVFLWLVIAAFIILYVPALDPQAGEGTPGEVVMTVGDREITVGEFRRAYYRQRQFYDRLYQGRLDENMLRQLRLEEQTLQALVTDRLVELEAERLGIQVSDEALTRALQSSPDYQEEGRFIGAAELRRRLQLAGLTEQEFEGSLRRELLRERLEGLVTDDVFVSEAEAEREYRRRTEQVRLEYVLVEAEPFRDEVEPTEEEIVARFEAERESYRIPERRVVDYVLLDRETLRPQVTVSDRDIELYYQDHRDEFVREEEFCARHILVKVRSDPSGEGHPEADARRIAEALLERVRAGADFEALARASSEDEGSAANGGDLGCFPSGRMVPEFDDALFGLDAGETSDLVRTSFGYHIIRLDSRREEAVLPLAEVQERIRFLVTDRKMSDLGDEKSQALASALERGRTLAEAAAEQGLVVQRSAPFAKGETPPGLDSPSLAGRVFRMEEGQVEKEGFALPQGAAFIALAEIQPPRLPELDEARERVRSDIIAERAFEKARDQAARLEARAKTVGLERAAAAAELVRKETPSLTGRGQALGDLGRSLALEEVAFSLPEEALSEPVRVPGSGAPPEEGDALSGGWAIIRVLERKSFDSEEFAQEKPRVVASLRQQKRGEVFQAYIRGAQERYAVRRRPDAYKRAIGEE